MIVLRVFDAWGMAPPGDNPRYYTPRLACTLEGIEVPGVETIVLYQADTERPRTGMHKAFWRDAYWVAELDYVPAARNPTRDTDYGKFHYKISLRKQLLPHQIDDSYIP